MDQSSQRNIPLPPGLGRHEASVREWMERCSINAIWYACDPIGAIRSANLGIDETILQKLEDGAGAPSSFREFQVKS